VKRERRRANGDALDTIDLRTGELRDHCLDATGHTTATWLLAGSNVVD